MRVLVTGGAGYVGSHSVRALTRRGHDVVVLDDLSRGSRATVARLGVPLLEVDLRDGDRLETALREGFDAVLHFAACSLVAESVERPDLYWDTNFRGGQNLLEAMRRAEVRRLIVSSTAAVYGEPSVCPIPEDAPKLPVNPYGATKLAFEHALARDERAWGLRWLALRYFNAAGASDEGDLGERHDPETHLLPRLLIAVERGEPFSLFGLDHATRDGTCLRDFVHVEDLARAHVLALEQLDAVNGLAMNIGTGTGTTVREVVAAVERVLDARVDVAERPRRPGDPARLVADPSLAARLLGFRTERTVEDAIRSQHAFMRAST
jgi:UDP-glucose-4-epimerase GalE